MGLHEGLLTVSLQMGEDIWDEVLSAVLTIPIIKVYYGKFWIIMRWLWSDQSIGHSRGL